MVRNTTALDAMKVAGAKLAALFDAIVPGLIRPGISTLECDAAIATYLQQERLISQSQGYHGYRHVSCISVNDVVVHGVPSHRVRLQPGDLVTVDVCAAWNGYCADMARSYIVPGGSPQQRVYEMIAVAHNALDAGMAQAVVGARVGDISYAIQTIISEARFGIVRDFAGHGIGRTMHQDPEILNYGAPAKGPQLYEGMGLAIEPMLTMGSHKIIIDPDGWTARTVDGGWSAHVEDTLVVTADGPVIVTRP